MSAGASRLVSDLFIYPLKSAQAQSLKSLSLTHQGPEGDRQWMLVDEQGEFISQRTVPELATVQVHLNEQGLSLGLGKQFFVAPPQSAYKREVTVRLWGADIRAALEADLFSQAISQYLGIACRLVRYAPFSERQVGTQSPEWSTEVRFADSRPVSLVNLKSLEDLNQRLATPVGMDRFRANIVVQGQSAFEEDQWSCIKIGPVFFSQPKKCVRCKIVTVNQLTGVQADAEPLKTLSTYRRDGGKVCFGVLWIPENPGIIKRGDSLEVVC